MEKYLEEITIRRVAHIIRNNDGKDATSIRSCDAKSNAFVEKVSKLKVLLKEHTSVKLTKILILLFKSK